MNSSESGNSEENNKDFSTTESSSEEEEVKYHTVPENSCTSPEKSNFKLIIIILIGIISVLVIIIFILLIVIILFSTRAFEKEEQHEEPVRYIYPVSSSYFGKVISGGFVSTVEPLSSDDTNKILISKQGKHSFSLGNEYSKEQTEFRVEYELSSCKDKDECKNYKHLFMNIFAENEIEVDSLFYEDKSIYIAKLEGEDDDSDFEEQLMIEEETSQNPGPTDVDKLPKIKDEDIFQELEEDGKHWLEEYEDQELTVVNKEEMENFVFRCYGLCRAAEFQTFLDINPEIYVDFDLWVKNHVREEDSVPSEQRREYVNHEFKQASSGCQKQAVGLQYEGVDVLDIEVAKTVFKRDLEMYCQYGGVLQFAEVEDKRYRGICDGDKMSIRCEQVRKAQVSLDDMMIWGIP